jgi:hypothetical protein
MNNYDNDDHIKNMQNSDANSYCPNGNPVLEFAGRQWWINYHWSPEVEFMRAEISILSSIPR